jgi:fatty acid desaturase
MAATAHTTTAHTMTAHLTGADIDELGRELDQIREEVIASRGEGDARYIRRVIAVQRELEVGGRVLLFASILPPAWLAGTAMLATAKILENMEIGHNVLHGQWDWMRDPKTPTRRSATRRGEPASASGTTSRE